MKKKQLRYVSYLELDRLIAIPERHWPAHEFSFYLHDQLLHMLTQYEEGDAHNLVVQAFMEATKGQEDKFEGVDILEFLKKNDLVRPYEHHILSHVTLAVVRDMLHFIYEALSAFEKRKFSVGFSLLRKPLKEHLFFLCWVLADKEDFISRFEGNNHQTLNNVGKERKLELFDKAIWKVATPSLFSSELIWNMIYAKSHARSLEPLFQRATHLVTSMGDLLKTEDYSLNFVFVHPGEDYFFDRLYDVLPYILIFTAQVSLAVFNRIHNVNSLTYSHMVLCTMGCYEAIFSDSKSQTIAKMLNNNLGELLKCAHCKKPLRINRGNAVGIYLREQAICRSCRVETPLPLYWLFGLVNLNLVNDDSARAQ